MTREQLRRAAQFYANIDNNKHLVRAVVSFDERDGHLIASYIFDREPNDDDREACELFFAELAAAFPEIKTGDTICERETSHDAQPGENEIVVLSR